MNQAARLEIAPCNGGCRDCSPNNPKNKHAAHSGNAPYIYFMRGRLSEQSAIINGAEIAPYQGLK
jgi:hypothetical protein